MDVLSPENWQEALELKARHPDAVPIAGGTDLMVELNFDRRRPATILDLTRIPKKILDAVRLAGSRMATAT